MKRTIIILYLVCGFCFSLAVDKPPEAGVGFGERAVATVAAASWVITWLPAFVYMAAKHFDAAPTNQEKQDE